MEILNTWSTSIEIEGNLTLPTSFLDKLKDYSNETETQYYATGVKGVIGNCTFIPGNQSRVSIFRFPTQGSFVESEYYNLEIKWRLVSTIEDSLSPTPIYTQMFNVTPFDWIDQRTMMPMDLEDEEGEKDYNLYDLRITTVSLPDSSIYKGDSVEVRVTVHNYGMSSMKAFLNAEIKEDSGLYIGFDKGVWSYYGNGVDMIYYVRPGITYTYYFAFGPILYDDYRGVWALNGRIDADSYQATSLWYRLYQVKLRGYSGGFRTTGQYFCSKSFSVIQKSSTPRILAAVVDDETCWVDPAAFFEGVVDYSIRIGEGWNLGSYSSASFNCKSSIRLRIELSRFGYSERRCTIFRGTRASAFNDTACRFPESTSINCSHSVNSATSKMPISSRSKRSRRDVVNSSNCSLRYFLLPIFCTSSSTIRCNVTSSPCFVCDNSSHVKGIS
ncbi:MAG: hypothetical protein ACTSUZ_00495 [Candidatus Thorarchaeota archaeon]